MEEKQMLKSLARRLYSSIGKSFKRLWGQICLQLREMTWYEIRMFLINLESSSIHNLFTSTPNMVWNLYIILLENKTTRYKYNGYCAIRISFRNFFRAMCICVGTGHVGMCVGVYIIHTHLRIFSLHFITWRLSSGDSLKCFSMAILRLMGKTWRHRA